MKEAHSAPCPNYVEGDATRPTGPGPKVIPHVCNDVGAWGKGFAKALSQRWPEPEEHYRAWYQGKTAQPFAQGEVQFVQVEPELWVANIIAQHGLRPKKGVPPIRYEALRVALQKVARFAIGHGASVHMPKIGAGLAGGDWNIICRIIDETLCRQNIPVTVYVLPAK